VTNRKTTRQPLQPAPEDAYHRIEPLPETVAAMADLDRSRPVRLVAITRHHGEDLAASRDAYFAWGGVFAGLMAEKGGQVALTGQVLDDLYEDDCPWHEVSVHEFDHIGQFLAIALSETVQDALPLRRKAMVDSHILILEDLDDV
jgi:hypothetical protein